jgi:hypothetical protein
LKNDYFWGAPRLVVVGKCKLYNVFQDLVENPQYSLIMQKDSAAASFFTSSENTMRNDEATLWQRTENCPNCFVENYEMAEKQMLENPQFVYFDSKITISGMFKHYPCHIGITSASLARVIICNFFLLGSVCIQ